MAAHLSLLPVWVRSGGLELQRKAAVTVRCAVRDSRHCRTFSSRTVCTNLLCKWWPIYSVAPNNTIPRLQNNKRFLCSVSGSDGSKRRFFPRRAVMYVPANDERKTNKVKSLNVDTVVFDLEDGVAMNQKGAARNMVASAVSGYRDSGHGSHQEVVVRVNGVDSGMLEEDLRKALSGSGQKGGAVNTGPDSIMLPKCESIEHLRQLDLLLAGHAVQEPRPPPLLLHALIESPRALLDLRDILHYGVESAKHFVFAAVVFGSDDFLAAIGGTRTRDAREVVYARQSIVTHAKAFHLDAIDLVDINYKELDSLQKLAETAAWIGFTGKQVIHPDQVPVVQAAFSPSPKQLEWARGLTVAFHEHQASGKGAFEYKGASIDRPLLLQAENILRLQEVTSSPGS